MPRLPRRPVTIALVALLVLTLSVATAVAQRIGYRGGALRQARVISATDPTTTTGTTFVALPGAGAALRIGANAPHQHVLVTFSGESTCATSGPSAESCRIRVLVDGREADPVVAHEVAFDDATTTHAAESHAVQRVYGPLGPGRHTIHVQYATSSADTTFTLDDWTLSVLSVVAK